LNFYIYKHNFDVIYVILFFAVNIWFHSLLQVVVVVVAAGYYFSDLHGHQIILFEVSFSYLFKIIRKKML